MARRKFRGGVAKTILTIPDNIHNPIAKHVTTHIDKRLQTVGVEKTLRSVRQNNDTRTSQIWVWDNKGMV